MLRKNKKHNPLFYAVNSGKMKKTTYRRWTKYSNLEEKIGLTPPSLNVKVKQRVREVSCCGVWFVLSTRLNPWKKKPTLKFGGRGDKVVQGLNILSIYGIMDVWPCLTHHMRNTPNLGCLFRVKVNDTTGNKKWSNYGKGDHLYLYYILPACVVETCSHRINNHVFMLVY